MKRLVVKMCPEEQDDLMMHLENQITEACKKVAEEHNNDWCAWICYLDKITELYEFYNKLIDDQEEE